MTFMGFTKNFSGMMAARWYVMDINHKSFANKNTNTSIVQVPGVNRSCKSLPRVILWKFIDMPFPLV